MVYDTTQFSFTYCDKLDILVVLHWNTSPFPPLPTYGFNTSLLLLLIEKQQISIIFHSSWPYWVITPLIEHAKHCMNKWDLVCARRNHSSIILNFLNKQEYILSNRFIFFLKKKSKRKRTIIWMIDTFDVCSVSYH